jgi:hypothetical protein
VFSANCKTFALLVRPPCTNTSTSTATSLTRTPHQHSLPTVRDTTRST